jgi:hypothetical protein
MPDTTIYLFGGLAVIFIILTLYIISLFIRNNNALKDVQTIEQLAEE